MTVVLRNQLKISAQFSFGQPRYMCLFEYGKMDEPQSPILSCKKNTRKVSVLTASPVLSNRKKRRRRRSNSESPVFLRSNSRTGRNRPYLNGGESPVIENFSSPPTRKDNSIRLGLQPKSLFADIDETCVCSDDNSQTSIIVNSPRTYDHFIEEESLSGSENDELIIHEKSTSDVEGNLNASTTASLLINYCSFYTTSKSSYDLFFMNH